MAKVLTRTPFKRGDTACFIYKFNPPYANFDWSDVTVDCALTNIDAPTSNTGAAATRLDRALEVDSANVASYGFQLTFAESKTLVPGATYKDECQLKQSGSLYVTTPITGQTKILQDYVI